MEKTIIINIGNTIIHIEESAYELLKSYLTEVKMHFANHADDLEIVTDIENRIAELLTEQLGQQKKQVVDTETVNMVVAQMGKVQDFETSEDEGPQPVLEESYQYHAQKKLYRDMDERIVAGVCAGIAHYINIEARWVRLIMVISVILGGAGIMFYGLLWIIMPKAESRLEKMEMKGEPANLQGFQKNLDEELQAVKERLKVVNQHAQPLFAQLGTFIGEFFEWFGTFMSGTGKVIFKLIAGFIVFVGFIFLISLLISLAAILGFYDGNAYHYFPLSIINYSYRNSLVFAVFIVLIIPILALVLFSIRVAFNRMAINKTFSYALLIIWLGGVAATGYYIAKISSEFKEHAELSQSVELKKMTVYILDMDKSMIFSKQDSLEYQIDQYDKNRIVIDNPEDNPFSAPRDLKIDIEKSDNGKTSLIQVYAAQGKTFKLALQNAQNINYHYQQKDSLLIFSPRLQLKTESNWRAQRAKMTLKIPIGTIIKIKHNSYRYINNYGWDCDSQEGNTHNDYSIWQMTDEGLKCKYELDHPAKTDQQN